MSHLPFTISAYFLNSVAVLIDKFLLSKSIPDPLVYVFYFSVFSLVALFILPFTPVPTLEVFIAGSAATLLWTFGAYFMFKALKKGLTSRVIPIIGTLIPLSLLTYYKIFENSITINQSWAALFLTFGLFLLILPALKGKIIFQEFAFELLASILFTSSYILVHQAYQNASFLTVFSWSKLVLVPVGVGIFLIPTLKKRVFTSSGPALKLNSKPGLLFLTGQVTGGIAELLLTYSISLANPALVNSLQGLQYIFLMIFSLAMSLKLPGIFQEKFTPLVLCSKLTGILFVGAGLFVLSTVVSLPQLTETGFTYSPRYAEELGLDPKLTFLQALDDLKIKKLRLAVYWDEIESSSSGELDFSDEDFYLQQAQGRDIEVILAIGYKTPRWPECFEPLWSKDLSKNQLKNKIKSLVLAEIAHFKNFNAVTSWQVENEPLLPFGVCTLSVKERRDLLKEELQIVRQLDPRPIMLTTSGELASWSETLKLLPDLSKDSLGFTMYRQVWSPWFGQVDYPIFPAYYYFKNQLSRYITKASPRETIVAELQAEPWPTRGAPLGYLHIDEQIESLSLKKFKQNIQFAQESGFKTAYLWGLEWWYFMASKNHPEYLEYVQSLVQ